MHTSKVGLTLRDWNLGGWHFSARTAEGQRHLRAIPGQCTARMPGLLPHPERAPSIQDHEAVSGLLQSRPAPSGHQPAHPLLIRATPAGQGNDHGSPCPRRLASRLPPAHTGSTLTPSRCLSVSQWRASCPPASGGLVVGYNRIALAASFQWKKCVLAA
jgi:hypothetical protein